MSWLTNWNYRKPITISNAGTALTDYQIQITVDTAALVAAGKMQLGCNDIRFTSSYKHNSKRLSSSWINDGY